MTSDILTGLNDSQIEAVTSENNRVLVIAGAGSGKTSVLTRRISYIINNGFSPDNIFAVTFTNKAAKEMKDRVEKLIVGTNLSQMWIGTFHSSFNKILRAHSHLVNVDRDYQIIDDDDQKKILKFVIAEELKLFQEYESKERNVKIKEAILEAISYISKKKDFGDRPETCTWSMIEMNMYSTNLLSVYELYEEKLRELNVVDFGDLILYPYIIFKNNPEVLRKYQANFKHVLVDEFQDTNFVQYELVKMLAKKGNLFVVGDDDQSIYEWRGAQIENILGYDELFSDAHVIKLEQNYRSTENILNGANGLIGQNKKRKGKNLWSDKGAGKKIQVSLFETPYDEAGFIASSIKEKMKQGMQPKDFAILYRINALSRTAEMKLNDYQIPYKIVGGLAFWARSEIKDIIAYLAVVENPSNYLACERIINTPTRGIGEKTFIKIRDFARDSDLNIMDAIDVMIGNKSFPKKTMESIKEFNALIAALNDLKQQEGTSIKDYIEYILGNTGIIDFYKEDGSDKGDERIANIMELISASEVFERESSESSIQEFINFATLQTTHDKDKNSNSVQLMTVHTAKGLEFKIVYVIGMEMDIFPSARSINENKIEEERRLAYVALTRAKEELYVSCTSRRFPNKEFGVSLFIGEIPSETTEITDHRASAKNNNYNFYKNDKNEKQAKSLAYDNIKPGKKITHKKYGKGEILSVRQDGGYFLITVDFEEYGKKTIMMNA